MIEVLSGVLTLQNMMDHKVKQTHDIDFSVENDLLWDLGDAIISITMQEVDEYVQFLSAKGTVFGKIKSATLVSTANQLVYYNAFKKFEDILPQQMKIFNKMDSTLEWLGKTNDKEEICLLIDQMKRHPQFEWSRDQDAY